MNVFVYSHNQCLKNVVKYEKSLTSANSPHDFHKICDQPRHTMPQDIFYNCRYSENKIKPGMNVTIIL